MEIKNTIGKLIYNLLINHNQIILTGAPGTGKTYNVRKYLDTKNFEYKFIQFHPSYDYSNFVEGLKPVVLKQGDEPTFVKMDGSFKKFCRYVVGKNCKESGINVADLFKQENLKKYKDKENNFENTYYFVIDEINRADLSKVFGELMFVLEKRGISNLIKLKYQNLNSYELDSSGIAKPIKDDCFKNGFFVPKNIKIIGTMNNIDRSVEAFDFALRRRFVWVDINTDTHLEESINDMYKNKANREYLINKIKKLNNIISGQNSLGRQLGLNKDYEIGHAYFKNIDVKNKKCINDMLKNIFKSNIEPLLREYTRGRNVKKVNEFIDACKKALVED